MNNNTNSTEGQLKNLVFDYRALRLMMGLIAISLPFVVSLFSILAYFCLGPFRVKKENDGRKRQIRLLIYPACGLIMIISIMGAGILTFALNEQSINHYRVIFWSESIALCAFGVAWITAGKYFRPLVDEEEALVLFQQT